MRFAPLSIVLLSLVSAAGAVASEGAWPVESTTALASFEVSVGSPADPVFPEKVSCIWPCSRCGLSATALIIGGTAGLTAACGAAVATAGGLTAACIASGVAYFAAASGVVDSCLACDQCLNPPPASPDGDKCPAGYHACCENRCCSTTLPPGQDC